MGLNQYVQFALFGLATGAIYALLGQGIIVIYRGAGIVNFAQGAIAMLAAFIFVDRHFDSTWGFWPAFVLAVGVAAVIGALTHLLVMRPMRRSAPLMRLIATLGVLTVLTAYASLEYGTDTTPVASSLPTYLWHISWFGLNVNVTADRVYLFLIAVGLTVVLTCVYRYTRFGLAVSAAAENERAAAALGWSPDVLAMANWTIGAALAGIAGIFIVPTTGLNVQQLTLAVVAALATALIGNFKSFPLALLGGCAIGVAQNEINLKGTEWFGQTGQTGLAVSLPFLVIVFILIVRGRGLPLRSHVLEKRPRVASGVVRPIPLAVASAVFVVLALTISDVDVLNALISTAIIAVILLSLVLLTGYTGQISLGQFALAGIGAFVTGRLMQDSGFLGASIPFEVAFFIGIAAAGLFGLLFAIPALRTRGVNLAVVTLGLGAAVHDIVFNNYDYTGGIKGTKAGSWTVFGLDIDSVRHPDRYLLFVVFWFVVVGLIVTNIRRGRVGRRLLAVRTNERAAASLGISVFAAKIYAFAVSAAIAGLGGILLSFRNRTLVFDTVYTSFQSINVLVEAVVGGIGYVVGPLFGAQLDPGALGNLVVRDFVNDPGYWLQLVGGIGLIVVLIALADGLASVMAARFRGLAERIRATPTPLAPSEAEVQRVKPARLQIRDLKVQIGAALILNGIDLDVGPGEVVGLIGPNGAGKTILIDAVTGFVKATGGTIELDGVQIDHWSAARRARAHLTRSFQSLELFEDLSVRENLRAASEPRDGGAYLTDLVRPGRWPLQSTAIAAVHEFALTDDLDRLPTDLPYGRRRLVAIARAVATGPSVLLLDEPAAGLSTAETSELARLVRRLASEWGMAVLLIEHDMTMVFRTCDRVAVMDFGVKIAEGPPAELVHDPRVIAAYLGSEAEPATKPERAAAPERAVERTSVQPE